MFAEVDPASDTPSISTRLVAALGVGILMGVLTNKLLLAAGASVQANDFTYPWVAARAIAHGQNPYAVVRQTPTPWGGEFFYPVPAALVALPLAWLPARVAGAMFVGASCSLLALAVTRRALWPLLLFLSAPAFHVARGVQWSPLLMAASLWPPALGLVVAKPNLALPLLAFQTRRRAILLGAIGGLILIAAAFLAQPNWLAEWHAAITKDPNSRQYVAPIVHPLGAVVLLAVLRWRRPEARLLLLMACVPQNGFFYDQLPLMLVPARPLEMMFAVVSSLIAYVAANRALDPTGDVLRWSQTFYPYMIAGLYLPALALILRKPNEGAAPAWVRARLHLVPRWARGVDDSARVSLVAARSSDRLGRMIPTPSQ